MTQDQINRIIEICSNVPLIVSGATVSIFAIIKFFDYQKTRMREQSVGAEAIADLKDCMSKLTQEFESFKEKFKTQETKISELHSDNQEIKRSNSELVRSILDFIKR